MTSNKYGGYADCKVDKRVYAFGIPCSVDATTLTSSKGRAGRVMRGVLFAKGG